MVRFALESDVPQILSIYAPYVVHTTVTFEYQVPTQEEFLHRFREITRQFPWLVWEEDGRIIGYAYASAPFTRAAYAWCAEPTVYLRPEVRGKGIARKLYAAVEYILEKQGYQVLYALVCGENQPSLRFHQKAGYHIQAAFPAQGFKFDRWLDMIWMEKRLKTVEIPSNAPTSWRCVVQDVENFADILDTLSLF